MRTTFPELRNGMSKRPSINWWWVSGLALMAVSSVAAAQELRAVGYLTCDLAKNHQNESVSAAALMGQARAIRCSFRWLQGGAEETYVGNAQIIGQGQVLSNKRALIWLVKTGSPLQPAPGFLQQTYAAEAVAGEQASIPLVGDSNRLLSLQSLFERDPEASAQKAKQEVPPVVTVITLRLNSTPG